MMARSSSMRAAACSFVMLMVQTPQIFCKILYLVASCLMPQPGKATITSCPSLPSGLASMMVPTPNFLCRHLSPGVEFRHGGSFRHKTLLLRFRRIQDAASPVPGNGPQPRMLLALLAPVTAIASHAGPAQGHVLDQVRGISSRKREGGYMTTRPYTIRLRQLVRYSCFLARVMPT